MASIDQPLYITELRAENFCRIKAIRIRPDGEVVEITGPNEAGKTSTINSIAWALGGREFAIEEPLRRGTDKGEVSIDFGELRVIKSMRRGADGDIVASLLVENKDGSRPRSPQSILDELRGRLLDPVAFMRAKPEQRREIVASFVPGLDLAAFQKQHVEAFAARTDVNRELKRELAARDALHLPPGSAPERVDAAGLDRELAAASQANSDIETRRRNRENAAAQAQAKRDEAEVLRARARDLDAQADAIDQRIADAGPLAKLIDTSPLIARIREASTVNEKRRMFEQWEERDSAAMKLKAQADALTTQIENIAKERDRLSGGALPVIGLGLGDEDVTIDGMPFGQAAFSARLRVSALVAMQFDPTIRVMLVREFGSLLDRENFHVLCDLAVSHGFQIFIETVGHEAGPGRVIIEDGMIAATSDPRAPAATFPIGRQSQ